MSIYDWQKRFEIGNEHIDSEHRIFLLLIRKLADDLESNQGAERVLRTFSEFIHYTKFHFVSEENLMQDVEYPGYVGHRTLHEELLYQLQEHYTDIEKNRGDLKAVVQFLLDWFVRHTTTEDMNIGNFIADRNL